VQPDAVPEPTTMVLAAVGVAALAARRRRAA
jgi:MYXO-CTERM domain-containing protein